MRHKTLIFNYYGMANVGGIEKYINEVIGVLLESDTRIIWLKEKSSDIAQSFKKNMLNQKVEIVEVRQKGYHWFSMGNINLSPDEEITIVTFSPIDMGRALYLAQCYDKCNIKLLYAVPNTTGNKYFIEGYFWGPLKKIVAKRVGGIFRKWERVGILAFFSPGQIKPLEDAYQLEISSPQDKILPYVEPMPVLDEIKLRNRAKREPFKIITVGRFDFPHKGYMLGLISEYGKLKKIYPKLKLDIIGFGPHENLVKEEISKLNIDAQKDVRLLGEVAPENLSGYFDTASLNISVAGGVYAGVELGVFSIPARNYCYEGCEVYGFLPENKSMTTATKPGIPVKDFIEQVIKMPDEEYITRCKVTYEEYKREHVVNPYYFLEKSVDSKKVLIWSDICFLVIMHYMTKIVDYAGIMLKRLTGKGCK